MSSTKTVVGIAITAIIFACSCKVKNGMKNQSNERIISEVTDITMIQEMVYPSKKDDFTIDTMRVDGDTLEIDVNYAEHQDHEWTLFGNKFYLKSLPPQINLFLHHNAVGEPTGQRLAATLRYMIREIKYPNKESDYTIIVRMNETTMTVPYRY